MAGEWGEAQKHSDCTALPYPSVVSIVILFIPSSCLTGCQSWAALSILAMACVPTCLSATTAGSDIGMQMAETCTSAGHAEGCIGGGSHSSGCLSPPQLPTASRPWSHYSSLGQTGCQSLPTFVGPAACQYKSLDQMVSKMRWDFLFVALCAV